MIFTQLFFLKYKYDELRIIYLKIVMYNILFFNGFAL